MEQPAPLRTSAFSTEAAQQLLRLHRPQLALEMADRLLAQDPAGMQALAVRIEALALLRRLPEALSTARQAVAIAPQSAYTHAGLAWVYGRQGHLWAAVDTMQEALRLNPINADYHALLAQLQYLLRRPDETITSANRGLAINARQPDCLLWRALAEEQLNEPTAADLHFRQLLRLVPDNASAHAHRGKQLLRRSEPAQAATHLAAALQLAPTRSAELVPLLRQARREQHWPTWMVRRRQQLRQDWQAQGWFLERGVGTLLLLSFFAAYSWWLTRRDPLFQVSRTQVLRRWQKVWVGGIFLLPALIFLAGYFKILNINASLSIAQMAGLLAGSLVYQAVGYLLSKRIKQQPDA
jgi:tetratricopeptide (TPR) repeat protein